MNHSFSAGKSDIFMSFSIQNKSYDKKNECLATPYRDNSKLGEIALSKNYSNNDTSSD